MDAYNENPRRHSESEEASELVGWFSVSGDVDDFIYYWESADNQSER